MNKDLGNKFGNIKERILQIGDYYSVGRRNICENIGMTYGNFTGKAKDTPINSIAIQNIIAMYPEINLDWLLTGNGSMLREQQQEETNTPIINYEHKGAPYYDVDFIGGFDDIFNDQTTHPAYCIDFTPYNKEGVVWCNLTGHSMEPELNNGDVIAIREMKTPIEYLPVGEIYAFVTDEYRTVKRLAKSSREGFIKLVPSNKSPEYSEQEIPVSMVRKVFVVLGSIHKF